MDQPATVGAGHEVIVAHARDVRLIGESRRKDDKIDAQALAVWDASIRNCCHRFSIAALRGRLICQ